MIFRDRTEAGKHLATKLLSYKDRSDVLVLALPRRAVPVAFEVALSSRLPVSAPETCDEYRIGVDEITCAVTPEPFFGVGQWYLDFSQTTDEEVRDLLERARGEKQMKSAGSQ